MHHRTRFTNSIILEWDEKKKNIFYQLIDRTSGNVMNKYEDDLLLFNWKNHLEMQYPNPL